MLTVGSLFSGIGGIDLGLERAGMRVIWQAETDPYASKVLAKHWPDVPNLGDVTKIDWENDGLDYGDGIARSLHVDLVAGGFPCQPVSYAGKRAGRSDPRWLWPEFARCLRLLRPRHVLVENVPGLITAGFDDVLADLAALGFDAEWSVLSACAVGAPHPRERLFVVAHARSLGRERGRPSGPPQGPGQLATRQSQGRRAGSHWDEVPVPLVRGVAARLPHDVDRLRGLGNAVVPQVAEYVGQQILAHLCPCPCHEVIQPGLVPCPRCAGYGLNQ